MSKKMFCSALCLAAVLAVGLSGGWAAEKFDTDPKHQLPRPDKKPADPQKERT